MGPFAMLDQQSLPSSCHLSDDHVCDENCSHDHEHRYPTDPATREVRVYGPPVDEVEDLPATAATPITLGHDDSLNGSIAFLGDIDWVRIEVPAGATATITMTADGTGAVADPLVRLFDASGDFLYNETGYSATTSSIVVTNSGSAPETYFVSAEDYSGNDLGTYVLAVDMSIPASALEFSVADVVIQLTEEYWTWSGNGSSADAYAWDVVPGDAIAVDLSGLTAGGRAFALDALAAWTMVTGIEFNETTLAVGGAGIRFNDDDINSAYASFSNTSNGEIVSAAINIGTGWIDGDWFTNGEGQVVLDHSSYSFQTYIHEIGHVLGLGHAGLYNGNATYGVDNNYRNDSWQMSVMSYFSQSENTFIDASFAYVLTPMLADIAAVQSLYGVDGTLRAEDTIYGEGSTAGGYYDTMFGENTATYTILDDGGVDLLDLSGTSASSRVDLTPGAISDVRGSIGNLTLYTDTVIENLRTGDGNDTLMGNAVANILIGGLGDDVLSGGDGADTLFGGGQDDMLVGGEDDDIFVFAAAQGTVGDYGFAAVDQNSGEVSGDLIYLEGMTEFDLTSAGGVVSIGGISAQMASADGNIAVVASADTALTDAWSSGDLSASFELAGLDLTVFDLGIEEAFHTQVFEYDLTGALSRLTISYDENSMRVTDYDTDATRSWDTILTYFDSSDQLFDRRVNYDSGQQIRTITDVDEAEVWETILEYRDENGKLYDKRTNYDIGNQLRVILDVEEVQLWDTIFEYRDENGNLYDKRTNYDTGLQTRYIPDFDDSQVWTDIVENRDADNVLTKKLTTYDNDQEQVILFDLENQFAWDSHIRVFDTDGSLLSEEFV